MVSNRTTKPEGQSLPEYALILVLVSVVTIAVLVLMGPAIGDVYRQVTVRFGGQHALAADTPGATGSPIEPPPGPPGALTVTKPSTTTSATPALEWVRSPAADQVDSVEIAITRQGAPWLSVERTRTVTLTPDQYTCSGNRCRTTAITLWYGPASTGTRYVWKARAHNVVGWGAWGNAKTTTWMPPAPVQ